MIYGSVCSGIEAATVAWHPLGWTPAFFSEIEAFPRAVLSHHYPDAPLHGDFTTIEDGQYEPIDLLVGGTPCQDFSVAGLRAGMAGDRGNLTLQFLTLARRLRPRWLVWENVPGVLSSNGGRDFGSFLGGMGELGYGWAYRTLDAQYFGVPQRRRRVFVVGYLGDWRRAAAVLFERHSLQGNPPPSREARKVVAPTLSARTKGGGGLGTDFDLDGGLIAPAISPCLTGNYGKQPDNSDTSAGPMLVVEGVALRGRDGGATAELTGDLQPSLRCGGGGGDKPHVLLAYGGNNTSGAIDCAAALAAHGGPHGRQDFASETFVVAPTLTGNPYGDNQGSEGILVAVPILEVGARTGTSTTDRRAGIGIADVGDPMFTLQAGKQHAVAFSCKDHGADATDDLAPTLRAMGHSQSHANAGGQLAVCVPLDMRQCSRGATMTNNRDEGSSGGAAGTGIGANGDPAPTIASSHVPAVCVTGEIAHTLKANGFDASEDGTGRGQPIVARNMQGGVRRLTPTECEFLQGFPHNYTLVPYRGKPAADGPRYKALGNSMAVPVMRWLGERIEMVEQLLAQRIAAE